MPSQKKSARRAAKRISSVEKLPFVRANPHSMWVVTDNLDYQQAIDLGYEWGDVFGRFLLDKPAHVGSGLLYTIARDMRFNPNDVSSACAIGFFARVEQVLRTGASALVGFPSPKFADVQPKIG